MYHSAVCFLSSGLNLLQMSKWKIRQNNQSNILYQNYCINVAESWSPCLVYFAMANVHYLFKTHLMRRISVKQDNAGVFCPMWIVDQTFVNLTLSIKKWKAAIFQTWPGDVAVGRIVITAARCLDGDGPAGKRRREREKPGAAAAVSVATHRSFPVWDTQRMLFLPHHTSTSNRKSAFMPVVGNDFRVSLSLNCRRWSGRGSEKSVVPLDVIR